jgi:hypothetical protein
MTDFCCIMIIHIRLSHIHYINIFSIEIMSRFFFHYTWSSTVFDCFFISQELIILTVMLFVCFVIITIIFFTIFARRQNHIKKFPRIIYPIVQIVMKLLNRDLYLTTRSQLFLVLLWIEMKWNETNNIWYNYLIIYKTIQE